MLRHVSEGTGDEVILSSALSIKGFDGGLNEELRLIGFELTECGEAFRHGIALFSPRAQVGAGDSGEKQRESGREARIFFGQAVEPTGE